MTRTALNEASFLSFASFIGLSLARAAQETPEDDQRQEALPAPVRSTWLNLV